MNSKYLISGNNLAVTLDKPLYLGINKRHEKKYILLRNFYSVMNILKTLQSFCYDARNSHIFIQKYILKNKVFV